MERKEIDESSVRCKKCLQLGHWTFKCTNERKYLQRPTRTKLMKKQQKDAERKLLEPKNDSDQVNDPQTEQDENKKDELSVSKDLNDPLNKLKKTLTEGLTKEQKMEKLKNTINEMNNEFKLRQEPTSKEIDFIDKKRKKTYSSSSSSSSSSDSSDSDSSTSSSSSCSSSSSSSTSSSSSSDSSPPCKKAK